MNTDCFDAGCRAPADRELLGFRMCTPHFIEALEHSAHILSTPMGRLIREFEAAENERLRPARELLAARKRRKAELEEQRGRAGEFEETEPSRLCGETASPVVPAKSS